MKSIAELIKKIFGYKIIRYVFTGGVLFLIDFAIFKTLTTLGKMDIRIAQMISRSTGALVGFFGQKFFVFKNKDSRLFTLSVQGVLYIALTVLNIFLSGFLVYWLKNALPDWHIFFVKVINECIMVTETYIVLNLIFRKWKNDEETPAPNGTDNSDGSGE